MKKIKKTILTCLITLILGHFQEITAQAKIPSAFFGLNLWNTDYTGAPFNSSAINTFSSSEWNAIKETGGKTMRIGGIGYTVRRSTSSVPEFPRTEQTVNGVILDFPNPAGYVKMVDDCRANGFEPMITVPFNDVNKLRSVEEQALEAADIVRTVNRIHNRNVKYWIIGNEPEKTQGYTGSFDNVMMVRKYMMAFAQEMKNVDPDILIIGPDMEFANPTYFGPLFTSTATAITGTIPGSGLGAGKYYVDMLSYHSYGGFGTTWTTSTTPARQRYVDAGHEFVNTYTTAYSSFVEPVNTSRGGTPMKLVINEFNMHDNPDITTNASSSASLSEISGEDFNGNTFLAGQLIVDQMAAMLSVSDGSGTCMYEFSNIWSVGEGANYGIIHSNTDKKPTYWHYWLMSKYFNGTFYPNLKSYGSAGSLERCYKAYACRTSDYVAVLIMNQTQSTNSTPSLASTYNPNARTFTISFNGSGADFGFQMGGTSTPYSGTIAPSSTSLLFFNCDGSTYLGRYETSALPGSRQILPPQLFSPVGLYPACLQ